MNSSALCFPPFLSNSHFYKMYYVCPMTRRIQTHSFSKFVVIFPSIRIARRESFKLIGFINCHQRKNQSLILSCSWKLEESRNNMSDIYHNIYRWVPSQSHHSAHKTNRQTSTDLQHINTQGTSGTRLISDRPSRACTRRSSRCRRRPSRRSLLSPTWRLCRTGSRCSCSFASSFAWDQIAKSIFTDDAHFRRVDGSDEAGERRGQSSQHGCVWSLAVLDID